MAKDIFTKTWITGNAIEMLCEFVNNLKDDENDA